MRRRTASATGLVDLEVVLQTSHFEGKRSVAMQSGMGDGTSGVYGGSSADGTLTRLFVDFDLFG